MNGSEIYWVFFTCISGKVFKMTVQNVIICKCKGCMRLSQCVLKGKNENCSEADRDPHGDKRWRDSWASIHDLFPTDGKDVFFPPIFLGQQCRECTFLLFPYSYPKDQGTIKPGSHPDVTKDEKSFCPTSYKSQKALTAQNSVCRSPFFWPGGKLPDSRPSRDPTKARPLPLSSRQPDHMQYHHPPC